VSDAEPKRRRGGQIQRGEKTQPASIKITPSERATIEEAAALDGKPWSSWMIAAAVTAAERLIRRSPPTGR